MKKDEERKGEIKVGGIFLNNDKPAFEIIFPDLESTVKYKDMLIWILKDDKFKVKVITTNYDEKGGIRYG